MIDPNYLSKLAAISISWVFFFSFIAFQFEFFFSLLDATVFRMLSRRDVEVVVENGKPFLFKTGPGSLNKMSLYLTSGRQGIGKVCSIWQKASYSILMVDGCESLSSMVDCAVMF